MNRAVDRDNEFQDLWNRLSDFKERVLSCGDPRVVQINVMDLSALARNLIDISVRMELPKGLSGLIHPNDLILYGQEIVRSFFRNQANIEPNFNPGDRGRARVFFEDKSERTIKFI